jgi:uncharacterized protein YuzE
VTVGAVPARAGPSAPVGRAHNAFPQERRRARRGQMSALCSVIIACVRMTYDSEANAAYIYLVDQIDRGEVGRSCVADIAMDNAAITIDFDAEGRILGIEVLGASQALRAETIGAAENITRGT